MNFSAALDGLGMKYYSDYLDFLNEHGLLEASLHRAIRPWLGQFICHLFDCNHFHSILEIGRDHGHSFGLFRWLARESYIVSIDPKPTETAERIAELLDGPYLFLNMKSDDAFEQGSVVGYYDLILVDGNHHEAAARRDWENVLKVAAHQAVIIFDNLDHKDGCGKVFHDISPANTPRSIVRKIEPCGNQAAWPKGRQYGGTFGMIILS